jgi:hypothetical protein
MLHLLEALARSFQFAVRRLLGLLDERMQHDDLLANKKAVEGSADSCSTSRSQLEEPIAERSRVRKTEARSVFSKKFKQSSVIGEHINGP